VGAVAALRMGGLGGTTIPLVTEERLPSVYSDGDRALAAAAVCLSFRVVGAFHR